MSEPTKEKVKRDFAAGRRVTFADILDSGGQLAYETDDAGRRTDVVTWPDDEERVPFTLVQSDDGA
jgi:hypothetical protein